MWILALGLFGFIFWEERHWKDSDKLVQSETLVLPDLDIDSVKRVEIIRTNEIINVERVADGWNMTSPVQYPADQGIIEGFLLALAATQRHTTIQETEITSGTGGLEVFGLKSPRATVVLESKSGKDVLRLGGPGLMQDRVYIQSAGHPEIMMGDDAFLAKLPASADAWRHRGLLDLESVSYDRIGVYQPDRHVFEIAASTNRQWSITHPIVARADINIINHLLRVIQRVPVNRFVADLPELNLDDYGLQPPELSLIFFQGTQQQARLEFGAPSSQDTGQVYVLRTKTTNVVEADIQLAELLKVPINKFRDRGLVTLSQQQVARIQVHVSDPFILEQNTNQLWRVTSPVAFPADPQLVANLFTNLNSLRIVEFEKDVTTPTDFSRYGLNPPLRSYQFYSFPKLKNYKLDVELLAKLDFGSNKTDKVWVRRGDEDSVYATPYGSSLRLPQAAFQLRDRQIWNFPASNVVFMTIHYQGRSLSIEQKPNGKIGLPAGSQGIIEVEAIRESFLRLGQLRAVTWVASGRDRLPGYGFAEQPENGHRLILKIREGENIRDLTIDFGSMTPRYHVFAATELEGQMVIFEFPAPLYHDFVLPYLTLNVTTNEAP